MITIRNTRSQTVTAHVVLNGKDATVTLGPGSTREVDRLLPVSEVYVKSGVLKIIAESPNVTAAATAAQPTVAKKPPTVEPVEATAAPVVTTKKPEPGNTGKK